MSNRVIVALAVAGFALAAGCGGSAPQAVEPATGTTTPAATAANGTPAAEVDGSVEGPYRVLALGDSYTIGERVPRAENWPNQLRDALGGAGLEVDEPLVVAVTGWTTDDLLRATEASTLPPGPYDLVTLQIGVNNEFNGWLLEDFRPQLESLVARAVGFAGGDPERVVMLSIPDYGVTPAARELSRARIAASIDVYNGILKATATDFSVSYVDITPISREAAEDATLITVDGLHPSGAMYARWVRLLAPIVEERLRRLGAASVTWTDAEVAQFEAELALRRHP